MPEEIFEARRPRWVSVARIVNAETGRRYSGVYCREVATGYRTNSKLELILQRLGVMVVEPIAQAKRRKKIAA